MDTSARRFLGAPPRFGREEGGGGHALRCRLAVGAGQPTTGKGWDQWRGALFSGALHWVRIALKGSKRGRGSAMAP